MTAVPSGSSTSPEKVTTGSRLGGLLPDDRVTRLLAVQTLINTFGNGLFVTISAIFFIRSVGLSAAQVGLGLTVAGGCGVAANIGLGQLSDRLGAKRMLMLLYLAQAGGLLCYTLVASFPTFLLIACLVTTLNSGGRAVKNALLASALPPARRVRGRAYLRAVTNVGMGAGSAVAAVALQLDTRSGYLTLIAVDAATFLVAALLLRGVPAGAPTRGEPLRYRGGGRHSALTDRPYLAVAALNGVLSLQFGLIEVGVPVWVVSHTKAPAAVVGAIMITNTVLVVLLQVRASRGTERPAAAARVARRGGLVLAAACLVFGLAHGLSPVLAVIVLLAGAALQTLGEVLSSAAGWALSYDLADPDAPGAYQGVFSAGLATAVMLAPMLTTSTAIRFGLPGWALLAVLFAAAGAALVPVTRWAATRRPFTDNHHQEAQ